MLKHIPRVHDSFGKVEIFILLFDTVLQVHVCIHCMCQAPQLQAITVFPGPHLFTPMLVSSKSIPTCICKNRGRASLVYIYTYSLVAIHAHKHVYITSAR